MGNNWRRYEVLLPLQFNDGHKRSTMTCVSSSLKATVAMNDRGKLWTNSRGLFWATTAAGHARASNSRVSYFDLTDVNNTSLLRDTFDMLVEEYRAKELELPTNEGRDLKLRKLDCLVINRFIAAMESESGKTDESPKYQTVRCAFEEGDDAFPGSMLKTETHIQIAVRDPSCILGVFRPNL